MNIRLMLSASLLLSLSLVALAPSASAAECLAYTGDLQDPEAGVNVPIITGGWGPCARGCDGVLYMDKDIGGIIVQTCAADPGQTMYT